MDNNLPTSYQLLRIIFIYNWDWVLLFLLVYLSFRSPLIGDRWFKAIERFGARIASRKALAMAALIAVLVSLRLALLAIFPVPAPLINDEFSYLVAADTFAHGRLANPSHPMALYLDTFHVLQTPTYASMYPPAQGFFLAAGKLLGHPWIGVVISMIAFFAALLWLLWGWLPPRWAFLGALLLLWRIGTFSYWMNSYWGGAVAALGGALLMGALPRILRKPKVLHAVAAGIGIALLANSRPLEGVFVCAPVAIALTVWLLRQKRFSLCITIPAVVVPAGVVLLLTLSFMVFYNWRVTQHPLVMPHALDDQQHLSVSEFVWGARKPELHYANRQFDTYYNHWTRNQYFHTWNDFMRITANKFLAFWNFFLRAGLLIPLVAFPWLLLDKRPRLLLVQCACYWAGAIMVSWWHPHYAGPVIATCFALLVQMLRHLRRWEYKGRPVGIGLTRATVLIVALTLPVSLARVVADPRDTLILGWGWTGNWDRERIISQLNGVPGKQLVIVRYSEQFHNIAAEWVYNAADVDKSKIVWARDIPGADMRPLLDYFKDRTVWLVEADIRRPYLERYHGPSQLQRAAAARVPWE